MDFTKYNNTAGTHDIGYTTNYFYGSTGLPVEDQKAYDESNPSYVIGTIKQPDTPSFTKPSFKSYSVTLTSTRLTINWSIDPKSCPCYEYEIKVQVGTQTGLKTIHTNTISRPEQTSYTYSSTFRGVYVAFVTAKSISMEQATYGESKTIS